MALPVGEANGTWRGLELRGGSLALVPCQLGGRVFSLDQGTVIPDLLDLGGHSPEGDGRGRAGAVGA